jgi:hypothetical protein
MRHLAPAAFVITGLLLAASASADVGDAAPAPTPALAAPAAVAPPVAAPQAVSIAPATPGMSPYPPAYAPPYMMYPPPGAGAPSPYWMPATERRSDSMRTTGIVLFAAGGLISAVGGVLFGAVASTPCIVFDEGIAIGDPGPVPASVSSGGRERVRSSRQALNGCDSSPMIGLGIITAGVLTAVVGIPLFVIGSKQVPARTTTGKLVPQVSVGAANASLRWTF